LRDKRLSKQKNRVIYQTSFPFYWFPSSAFFKNRSVFPISPKDRPGEPALVDSTSSRMGEKTTYYSAVCLETGEVQAMFVPGNTNA
jgi:hypothetical protein